MPYSNLKELPVAVKENLPKGAQEVYKEAFNEAQLHYTDPDMRYGDETPEDIAHKVAWHAVRQKYEETRNGDWVPKELL